MLVGKILSEIFFLDEVGMGCFTFGPLGGFPALTGGCAVDRLRWRAQLGARVPLGLGWWLSPGATAAVIVCAPNRVQRLWPHGEAAGARMGKPVLRGGHRHESHAEMFAHVTSFVAAPYFSSYAVEESRWKSMEMNWTGKCKVMERSIFITGDSSKFNFRLAKKHFHECERILSFCTMTADITWL